MARRRNSRRECGSDTVDATVSRQFANTPSLVSHLLARSVPPQVIVVHLGTNGPVRERHSEETTEVAADVPLMVFVNAHVPTRDWESTTNRELAEGVERHDNAVLVDWHTPTKGSQRPVCSRQLPPEPARTRHLRRPHRRDSLPQVGVGQRVANGFDPATEYLASLTRARRFRTFRGNPPAAEPARVGSTE